MLDDVAPAGLRRVVAAAAAGVHSRAAALEADSSAAVVPVPVPVDCSTAVSDCNRDELAQVPGLELVHIEAAADAAEAADSRHVRNHSN